jgi:hypothetical protein
MRNAPGVVNDDRMGGHSNQPERWLDPVPTPRHEGNPDALRGYQRREDKPC